MIALLLFSLSSSGIIVYANGVENDVEGIISLEDIPDEEQIEPFDTICYEPIQTPQYDPNIVYTFNSEEEADSPSTVEVGDQSESYDQTIVLNPLTSANCANDTGNYVNDTLAESRGFENILSMTKNQFLTLLSQNGFEVTKYLNATLQGGCTDGTNVYYAYTVFDGSGNTRVQIGACIVAGHFNMQEVDVTDSNGTVTETIESEFIVDKFTFGNDNINPVLKNLSHMNDMTYNSLDNTIVFTCQSSDKTQKICVINADYFTDSNANLDISFHNVSCNFSSITYNETMNRYVVGVSGQVYYFCILDSEFNIVGVVNKESYVPDDDEESISLCGLECDDNYLYAVYYIQGRSDLSKSIQNVITIFDWKGNIVKELNLSINRQAASTTNNIVYEAENIIVMNRKIIVGFNCIYKVSGESRRLARTYHYDISGEFFNIQYCDDDNIQKHLNATDKKTSNVLRGTRTQTLVNRFKKENKKFTGWNLYWPERDRWYTQLSDGTSKAWRTEAFLQENPSYQKVKYTNGQYVSQTVAKNETVLFCAVWEDCQNQYRISFNSNGGSGTMNTMLGSTATGFTVPSSSFTKSSGGTTFQGWMVYDVQEAKWLYNNGNSYIWSKDGEAGLGYQKKIYSVGDAFNVSVTAGTDITLFAVWNEFTIYYDSNGAKIKANKIKAPSIMVYGSSNTIRKFVPSDTSNATSANFLGYNQYVVELGKWRYSQSDGTGAIWLYPNVKEANYPNYVYYLFTGNTVTQTCKPGRAVVFKAVWDENLTTEIDTNI